MNRGVSIALVAYVLWGLSPVFWRLGEGSAGSVLAFRVLATFVVVWLIRLGRDRLRGDRPGVVLIFGVGLERRGLIGG